MSHGRLGQTSTNSVDRKRKWSEENGIDKGTGMVWGANAPSVHKHHAKKDCDTIDFGDFGRYMAEKQRKLRIQFQTDASNKNSSDLAAVDVNGSLCGPKFPRDPTANATDSRTNLFEGISIFVDGFTIPSHQELRTLMMKHGGTFENYFRRDHVTHVICSTLPDSKIKDPRSLSRGLPIVKPAWVVDSIAACKILPVSSYFLERLARNDPNQSTLSNFMASKKGEDLRRLDVSTLPDVKQTLQSKDPGSISNVEEVTDDCPTLHRSCSSQVPSFGLDEGIRTGLESRLDLLQGSGSVSDVEDSKLKSTLMDGNVQTHCTAGDANFVQNFFKNSRLHFIGTWRTRYQSRYNCKNTDKDQLQENSSDLCLAGSSAQTIMHVDMDCFFVSVVVRNRPEFSGKPVAVCHSDKTHGTAEVSSSNYAARAFGVKSGMFIRDAKALCPSLKIVPYDFEGYQQVADQFYDILHKHCNKVQAISCDEAYLGVTGVQDAEILASVIRKDVFDVTRCTASVGIAGNLLLARMATRKAKPDGQFQIKSEQVEEFLSDLSVEDLPGVGWALQEKLHNQDIYKCIQLRAIPKAALQRDFGTKTGDMLWCYARGIDHRQVQDCQERKSIGAEVNWGVRFKSPENAQHFLSKLCEEVSVRLQNAAVCGRTFTLKMKRRKEGAGEPEKFMGCGSCDNLSKSMTLPSAIDSADTIIRVSKQIFATFNLDVCEIRGMGLQVTKLEAGPSTSSSGGQQQQKALESWLHSPSKDTSVQGVSKLEGSPIELKDKKVDKADNRLINATLNEPGGVRWGIGKRQANDVKGKRSLWKVLKGPFSGRKQHTLGKDKEKDKAIALQNLPHVSELDYSVLASLPPDILAEIDNAYDGTVMEYISAAANPQASNGSEKNVCSSLISGKNKPSLTSGIRTTGTGPERIAAKCVSIPEQQKPRQISVDGLSGVGRVDGAKEQSCSGWSFQSAPDAERNASIPLSLSQVDMATLEELPSQVQQDIMKSLPVHRPNEIERHRGISAASMSMMLSPLGEASGPCNSKCSSVQMEGYSDGRHTLKLDDLWFGCPPKWVAVFNEREGAGSELLQLLSTCYSKCGFPENLSVIFLDLIPYFYKSCLYKDVHDGNMVNSAAFQWCLELLKQYLKIKVSRNLEEVFMISQMLKRLGCVNHFWSEICKILLPYTQDMTREYYGGMLSSQQSSWCKD